MIESIDDLLIMFWPPCIIVALTIFIYRKYIVSVFDPLVFFLIMQAFSIEMALLQIKYTGYLVNFFACVICLNIGILCNRYRSKRIDDRKITFSTEHLKFVNYFNFFAFLFVVAVNMFFISRKGLSILSDDPSVTKFSDFDDGGGFGAIRRINWGLGNLILVSIFYMYVKNGRKRNLLMLITMFLISLTSGAKGVVLNYIFIIALIGVIDSAVKTKAFKSINKAKVPLLIVGFVFSLFILIKGLGEGGDINGALIQLGVRFLFFGDAIIYYYDPITVAHFQQYGFIDFLSYQFNSILGLLRIVEYKKPLGNELLLYYIKASEDTGLSIGPNTPYYINGHIFFGAYASLPFSFFIGWLVGYVRKLYFTIGEKPNSFIYLIILIYLNLLVFNFPQDTQLLITMLIDTIVFSTVPALAALLICSYKTQKITVKDAAST